jgi:hypothetical protein
MIGSAAMRTSNLFILIVLHSSSGCYFVLQFFLSFSLQMIEWSKVQGSEELTARRKNRKCVGRLLTYLRLVDDQWP